MPAITKALRQPSSDRRPARQIYLASSALSALSCVGMDRNDPGWCRWRFDRLGGIQDLSIFDFLHQVLTGQLADRQLEDEADEALRAAMHGSNARRCAGLELAPGAQWWGWWLAPSALGAGL
jgi:hypothetical protein